MPRPLVATVGIGSPFGADRLGWEAIDVLQGVADWPLPVELVKLDRPGVNLLQALSGTDHAILIDALAGESGPPRRLEPDALAGGGRLSTHAAGVAEVLRLGRTLGGLPTHLLLVGISLEPAPVDWSRLEHLVREALAAWADGMLIQ